MDTELLATQLVIPPPTRHLVARERLCTALELGVPDARLTLVAAPAGYGKTTLLAQWARSSSLPVAWLTAEEQENDPARFFRGFLLAWERVQPGIRASRAGLLLGGDSPDLNAVLGAIVRLAGESNRHLGFVLDDVHLITNGEIHRALDSLLDHLPPTVHLVVAGREAPPLSLSRRRARNELLELQTSDVRLDFGEAREFLNQRMGVDLAEHDIEWLQEQLEGWVAGLQLVGLTLRHRPDADIRQEVGGRHRHIADYLSDDVFNRLPKPTQAFLLQTSILARLCHPLCAAVTGASQSQAMLDSLERANLFVVPLDDHRIWFRYHRLFATFLATLLAERYAPAEIRALHVRAARWYLDHELPEEAFQHALDGDDIETATAVIDRYIHPKMFGGEFRVVAKWVASLPEPWLASRPGLALAEAQTLLFSGQPEACSRRLDDVDRLAREGHAEPPRQWAARATAIRCIIACHSGDLAGAEEHAERALGELPVTDYEYRAHIYHALGEIYREHRRWEEARENYLLAFDLLQDKSFAPSARLLIIHVFGALADLELRQGRMHKAAGYWSRAQAAIEDRAQWGSVALPISGWVYLRIGELHYEWDDLATARSLASSGLERTTLGDDAQGMLAGNVVLARLEMTDGNLESAETHLELARTLLDASPFPDWEGRFDRCQIDLWIAQGKSREFAAWLDETLGHEHSSRRPVTAPTLLAIARGLLHTGGTEALAQAGALLDRVIVTSNERGETGVRIEAYALRAMLQDQRGQETGMLVDLEHALRDAEPEGYVRLFADLGPPMAALLREARSRGVLSEYVDRLLAACGGVADEITGWQSPLVEPLSPRELDVLQLMSAGLSNREIAASLFVSPETVKKHAGSIYGKLGVRGRIEAVTRARLLDLIDEPDLPISRLT